MFLTIWSKRNHTALGNTERFIDFKLQLSKRQLSLLPGLEENGPTEFQKKHYENVGILKTRRSGIVILSAHPSLPESLSFPTCSLFPSVKPKVPFNLG